MTPEPNPPPSNDEITQLIVASANGSVPSRDRLLHLVYSELHLLARSRMRGERRDHTLGATALVNESYLRLFGEDGVAIPEGGWESRAALFAAAATTMRRILIDHARARASLKRGRSSVVNARVPLDLLEAARTSDPEQLIALDDALTQLEAIDERAAQVVRLRFYAALPLSAIAELYDITDRTVKRDWNFARGWLQQHLQRQQENDDNASS